MMINEQDPLSQQALADLTKPLYLMSMCPSGNATIEDFEDGLADWPATPEAPPAPGRRRVRAVLPRVAREPASPPGRRDEAGGRWRAQHPEGPVTARRASAGRTSR
ncbi:hypothetical protein RND61_02630 [Streptomyces sp. TRM76323]|uniref:Uncharacterized protein n=1 Tax=Streptomyces tamarix TaxID=3078565 RepID=A0ABU3QE16_9ACTN|nr:hypothetical protein [Streptomyces tamarix]MDT9680988.1 hypothetical protein [Streptomyces tamarix]